MQALIELHGEFVELYGYEVEICGAIARWHEYLKFIREKTGLTELPFAREDPVTPNSSYQYMNSFSSLIDASKKNGRHTSTHRRSVVALTYAIWEDEYRQKIANECGRTDKNLIQSTVFHELNMYRRGVLHAGGKLIGNPRIISFFKDGEIIYSQMSTYIGFSRYW